VAQVHDARQVSALVRVLGDVLTLQQIQRKTLEITAWTFEAIS
jgi:hypothetical protein